MSLQFASEEPKNSVISPVSEEQETVEMLIESSREVAKPPCPAHIRRILTRLPQSNPVKPIAESLLAGEALDEARFATLIKRLQNPSANRWKERTVASWILGNVPLTEEQKQEVLPILGNLVEKSHKQDKLRVCGRFLWRSGAYFLLLAALVTGLDWLIINAIPPLQGIWHGLSEIASWIGEPYGQFWDGILRNSIGSMENLAVPLQILAFAFLTVFIPAPISLPVSLMLDRRRQNRVRKEATASLMRLGSLEALPYLLAAIGRTKGELYQELLDGVATLLPRLTPKHYGQFRSDVVPNLCYLLENYRGNFVLVLLDAVQKIGDSRALLTVRRLAEKGESAEVRAKAKEVLPILEARREQENDAHNLLRASSEPVSQKELLRPAYNVTETQPETLLRPIDASPKEETVSVQVKPPTP